MPQETKNIIQLKESTSGPNFYPETHKAAIVGKEDYTYLGEVVSPGGGGGVDIIQLTKYDGTPFYPLVDVNSVAGLSTRLNTIGNNITSLQNGLTSAQGSITTLQGYFDANGKVNYANLPNLYIGNARVMSSAQTAQDIGGLGNLTPGTTGKNLGSSSSTWNNAYIDNVCTSYVKSLANDTNYIDLSDVACIDIVINDDGKVSISEDDTYIFNSLNVYDSAIFYGGAIINLNQTLTIGGSNGAHISWVPRNGNTPGYIYIDKPLVTAGDQIVGSGTPGGGGGGGSTPYLTDLLDVIQGIQPSANKMLIWTSQGTNNAGTTGGWTLIDKSSVGVSTDATQSAHGLMSTADKIKLDSIQFGTQASDYIPITIGSTTKNVLTAHQSLAAYATQTWVNQQIDALPEPMVFKGSLGTGGTVTSLPAASSSNEGHTYKVITAGTYQSITAKVGDTFISTGSEWVLIPSGDEPEGTVTSVGLSVPTGLSVSGSPITTSGTLAISFASGYSIPTTANQTAWSNKYDKPSTGIPNSHLENSSITINGSATSLGGSFNTANITAGTVGTSSATSGYTLAVPYVTYNKYGIITSTGTHTHTVNNIPNSSLANSSITVGSTVFNLGDTKTSLAGLVNVTMAGTLKIGDAEITWDGTNGYLKINKPLLTIGDQIVNSGTPGGGGGGGSIPYLTDLQDVIAGITPTANKMLIWTASGTNNAGTTGGWTLIDKSSVGVTTNASQSAAGLMSSADKIKLDAIEAQANKYVLPIASASVLGGIKVGSGLSINASTGVLDATYTYTLPLAANGTRGGIQIGYSSSGKNYAVQLSSEKAYVNVPWTNTIYKLTLNGTVKGTTGGTDLGSFYAPTTAGTQGYVLKSNGSGAPVWSNDYAIKNHLYHYLTSNTNYYDSYDGTRLFRIVTENFLADTLRFRASTITNIEYWDFTNSVWATWNTYMIPVLFDGNPGTNCPVPYEQRKFRFEIVAASGWPSTPLVLVQGSWYNSGAYTPFEDDTKIRITLETKSAATDEYVVSDSFGFTDSPQGANARIAKNLHTGYTRYRITIEICPWANTENSAILRRVCILSNYSGNPLQITRHDGYGNYYPIANNTYSLGRSGERWSTVYGVNANFSGALTVAYGGASIKGTGNAITKINGATANVDYAHIYVTDTANNTSRPLVLQNGYGNVGIGVTQPSYKLAVGGTFNVTGLSTLTGGAEIPSTATLKIGDATIEWIPNSGNGYLKIDKPLLTTGDQIVGSGTPSGGGGGGSASYLSDLLDLSETITDKPSGGGYGLVYSTSATDKNGNSGAWIYVAPGTAANISGANTTARLWSGSVIKSAIEAYGYVTSSGVTSVATGIGLTGGTITNTGTLKVKLKNETLNTADSAKSTSTNGGLYSIEADKSGNLAVRVPWVNTWNAASTSQAGYVPKLALASTATIATQSTEYVLTYISGTETAPVWRKLPANAFNNNTYTNGTGISLSGNTFSLNVAGAKTALGLGTMAYEAKADYVLLATAQTISAKHTFSSGILLNTASSWTNSDRAIAFSADGEDANIRYYYTDSNKGLTFNPSTGELRAAKFIKRGGTSSQFLKADGSVDSSTYLTGNQTITLSGDVSGSGTTSISVSIGSGKVTNAMLAGSIAWSKLSVSASNITSTLGTTAVSRATADADGNTISSTYVKKAGDTMSGDLIIEKTGGGLTIRGDKLNANADGGYIYLAARYSDNERNGCKIAAVYPGSGAYDIQDLVFYSSNNRSGNAEPIWQEAMRIKADKAVSMNGSLSISRDGVYSIYINNTASNGTASGIRFQLNGTTKGGLFVSSDENLYYSVGTASTGNRVLTSANYDSFALPLSAGSSYPLTGHLYLNEGLGIQAVGGVGLLVYHPTPGWSGIDSTQWGLGSVNSQGVIRSSNSNLLHYKGSTSYSIWDASNSNLSTVDWAANNLTAAGIGTFDRVVLSNSGAVSHIEFTRAGWNYISVPTDGVIAFNVGGSGSANTSMAVTPDGICAGTKGVHSCGLPTAYWGSIYGKDLYLGGNTHNTAAGSIIFSEKLDAQRNGFKIAPVHATSANRVNLVFYRSNNGNSPWAANWTTLMTLSYDGKVTIAGSLTTSGDQVISSDASLKKNWRGLKYGVADIAKATAGVFDWKDGKGESAGTKAQDWMHLVPQLVHGEEGHMTLAYGQIAMLNTILLARRSEDHETRIKALEAENAKLKEEIKRLKS